MLNAVARLGLCLTVPAALLLPAFLLPGTPPTGSAHEARARGVVMRVVSQAPDVIGCDQVRRRGAAGTCVVHPSPADVITVAQR